IMFLRCNVRRKDGKQHRYWSVVENTRVARGPVVQRHVLYLGEINDMQELEWRRSIEVLEEGAARPRTLSLFPEDRCEGLLADSSIVRVKLSELRLRRPRQWGACWLALLLWRELQLDLFWSKRLGVSRKGTHWDEVLFVLVAYRLLAPGSEWRLHREWFQRSALADLLGEDAGLAEIHKLYRCHDWLLTHKQAVFDHLVGRWRDLFNIRFGGAQAFCDNAIDATVLPELTAEDLKDLGVALVGHRRKLLAAIAALRSDVGPAPETSAVAPKSLQKVRVLS